MIERLIKERAKVTNLGMRLVFSGGLTFLLSSSPAQADNGFVGVYSQVNIPVGPVGGRGIISCLTDVGNTVIISSGDVNWIDGLGRNGSTPGKSKGEDRATIYAIEGPCGPGKGGEVNLDVANQFNAVEVFQNPNNTAALSGSQLAQLINMKVAAMRDPANHNGLNGGGLTGPVDIVVVKGAKSEIKETRVIEPGEWAADDDPTHQ